MGTIQKIRIVLSLVNLLTLLTAICYIVVSSVISPSISPMTSTNKETKEKIEISKIVNKNLRDLNIIPIKTPKFNKSLAAKKHLENKLSSYLEKDEFWRKGIKTKLPKDVCKRIAKNIVRHSKYPIITTSIIYTESDCNKNAINHRSKALGLGQITKIHEEELKDAGIINQFEDLNQIGKNIQAINFVLQQKLEITGGNMDKALVLYSGGANRYREKIWNKVYDIRKHIKEG